MTAVVADGSDDASQGPVVFVLVLLQAAFGLLASLGLLLFMGGNPIYAVVPLLGAATQFVLAGFIARDRRWAFGVLLAFEWLLVAGFAVNALARLLPWFDLTVNLVGLLTRVALPTAVMWLCIQRLRTTTGPQRTGRERQPAGRERQPAGIARQRAAPPVAAPAREPVTVDASWAPRW